MGSTGLRSRNPDGRLTIATVHTAHQTQPPSSGRHHQRRP